MNSYKSLVKTFTLFMQYFNITGESSYVKILQKVWEWIYDYILGSSVNDNDGIEIK